ncbi:MAG: RluA family pseudouridine synthase [Intestinibacillus sp.]
MMRTIVYTISPSDHGQTVEQYLRRRGISHALLVQLKRFPDGLLLNGAPVRTIDRLAANTRLEITLRETDTSTHIAPVDLPLFIVYEDEDLFVVDKPAGMPVHPSQGNRENALANALAALYKNRGDPFVFRAIGRLDKNTSGLVLLAKNAFSGCLLSQMLQKRIVRREYLAICQGLLPPDGTIDAPIARSRGSTLLREVRKDGDRAVTHFQRLSFCNGLSLARVWLDTGRTHQIRVHMAHIGHPLPGDFLYCPDFSQINRHALHAASLRFPQPITGKPLCFTSPLPEDMVPLIRDEQTRRA